jgi:DNA invertase Pin-like site-specific DNA recombinase
MKPLAAIVRSSDGVRERQADGTYRADEEQVEAINRYARELGKPVVFLAPELDVSGGLPIDERPPLLEGIEGTERREYAGIIVANLRRLTRSRSGHIIWERVEAVGGKVYCARERLDTSTPYGRRLRDHEIADATAEREEHAERFAARRRATVDAGMWRQRQTPRGYRFAGPPNEAGKFTGQARRLAIEPVGAEEVRQAALDVLAGVPVVRIAERLKMTRQGVKMMLKNKVYLGELWDGGYTRRDERGNVVLAHEPILDAATFDAVGEALRHAPRPARRVGAGPALLARIVICAGCGRVMTRKSTKSVVYACDVHRSGGRCPAPASIVCARLDEHVEALATERYRAVRARGHAVSDVDGAESALADVKARIKRVMRVVAAAGMDESDAADALAELRQERDEAERALREARARSAQPVSWPGDEAYRMLDVTRRNMALRGLLDRVVVTRSGRGGRPDVAGRVEVVWRD